MQQVAHMSFITHEGHRETNWLRDVILGGQDGLVNILGIALGVSAATSDVHIMVVAALAAMFAESISMGAVAYTSSLAQRDHYQSELEREQREMHEVPEIERQEIRDIYAAKGFEGELLERIVEKITSDDDTWLQVMMQEELNLSPVDIGNVRRTAAVVTVATLAGSAIPLLPFIVMPRIPAIVAAIAVSAVVLFVVGAYEAVSFVGDWRKHGLQMVVIGLGAAAAGFLIGRIFHTSA